MFSKLLSALIASASATDAPIIGVLSVPSDGYCETALAASNGSGVSCFASLYSKFIEAAGLGVAEPGFVLSEVVPRMISEERC